MYVFIFIFIFLLFCLFSRDLKPENLIMTSDDNNADLKIVDFGFAAIDTGGKKTTAIRNNFLNHYSY